MDMAASRIINEGHQLGQEKKPLESDSEEGPECAVCLQPCVLPTRLPCRHIFCFLCAKGLALQSRRCAMCRAEIPQDFIDRPELLLSKEGTEKAEASGGDVQPEKTYAWFYEGRNGWWQYEGRLCADLEAAYQRGERTHDALIAGSIYTLDFNNWVQQRRDDPSRRRRIKRDLATSNHKGELSGLPRVPTSLPPHVPQTAAPRQQPPPPPPPPPPQGGAGGRVGLVGGAPITSSYPWSVPYPSSHYAVPVSSDTASPSSSPDDDADVVAASEMLPPGLGLREVASRAGAGLTRAFMALTTSEPSSQPQPRGFHTAATLRATGANPGTHHSQSESSSDDNEEQYEASSSSEEDEDSTGIIIIGGRPYFMINDQPIAVDSDSD
ncbi:hypothetical protein B566_EDAN006117 [Ephemera danica]|nr:hypothetical protein B566_EDAN006117 [Ephemera danica]